MEIQISVRNLVEFMLREGDIDNRRGAFSENAMQEGSRIHRMLQKRGGEGYQAEVSLRHIEDCGEYRIVVDGRADGVIRREGRVIVDEIKGTYRDLNKLSAPEALHLAQAKCYAHIIAWQEHLEEIGVRMTYCNMDTEEVKYFHENFTAASLKHWFTQLMQGYRKWADFEYTWKKLRKESIHSLTFPFVYRKGQKELAGHVYQTICHGRKLFIQAPTGVGKTISALFPAIKAVGEDKADKIFYLTAKTITRTVAQDTFALLKANGLRYKTLSLTAKEKICKMEETNCNPDYCPYAKGHYSRINDAVYEFLTGEDTFDRETIECYAERHTVCPFEMALDMSLFSDAVICDYNYLFDPYAHLKRFFVEGVKGPYLFLVDEAHNLVERGRQMYSSELIKEDFLALKKTVQPYGTKLERYIDRCNKEFLAIKKETQGLRVLEAAGAFDTQLVRLHGAISSYLEEHDDSPVRQELLDFYFQLSEYLDVNEKIDKNYVTYAMLREDGSFMIKQFCVNPSERLRECMQQGEAAILFSATFLPIQYYKQLLGGDLEDFEVYASSSFSGSQMRLLIGRDVTSRYKRRSDMEYYNIAAYIHAIVKQRVGNYMVFGPSHAFLEQVYEAYTQYFHNEALECCLVQKERMNEQEREAFLAGFRGNADRHRVLLPETPLEPLPIRMQIEVEDENENISGITMETAADDRKSMIGFCVLGGIFSEGIDLKGEALISAIIIGTGIPQVCEERELLRRYFDGEGKDGFDYAYRYPGMNKVLQAAGRVIRSASDRGVVALLDERFLHSSYRKLFPREWERCSAVSVQECARQTAVFWQEQVEDK